MTTRTDDEGLEHGELDKGGWNLTSGEGTGKLWSDGKTGPWRLYDFDGDQDGWAWPGTSAGTKFNTPPKPFPTPRWECTLQPALVLTAETSEEFHAKLQTMNGEVYGITQNGFSTVNGWLIINSEGTFPRFEAIVTKSGWVLAFESLTSLDWASSGEAIEDAWTQHWDGQYADNISMNTMSCAAIET